jgi:hypothetical protein
MMVYAFPSEERAVLRKFPGQRNLWLISIQANVCNKNPTTLELSTMADGAQYSIDCFTGQGTVCLAIIFTALHEYSLSS